MTYTPTVSALITCFVVASLSAAAPDGYVLEWADEFDYTGAPNPEFWTHETGGGGWGNDEVQIYTDSLENSRVENGNLVIEVHQEAGSRVPSYTSARLITREKVQWKYGRMEVRAKLPSETGTWPAVWMLAADRLHGNGGWPDNGEIDIMEHVGYEEDPLYLDYIGNPELPNIHGTLHTYIRNGLTSSGIGDKIYISDASSAFHTYGVTWTEDRIEWDVDGVVYHFWDKPTFRTPPEDISQYWPFDQRFFMILNIAVGGRWGGQFSSGGFPGISPYGRGIDEDENNWPQRMEIDFVRVYRKDETAPATQIPGRILATDLDYSDGILIEQSGNPELPHRLAFIDPEDSAEFVVNTPLPGRYRISATVATPNNNRQLSISFPESDAVVSTVAVPNTGNYETWQTTELGEVELSAGLNTLTMSTTTGGFMLAAFDVIESEGTVWKGLQVDAFGNADTGTWLGIVNINAAPWIYSYLLEDYIYMPVALEEVFSTENQWIYFPK